MLEAHIITYLKKISNEYKHAQISNAATPELSFRPHLYELLKKCSSVLKPTDAVHVVFEPSNIGHGRPDFRLHDAKTYAVYCYLETKALDTKPINWQRHVNQVKRYLALGYPVILTDGIEFQIFEDSIDHGPSKIISLVKSKNQLLQNQVVIDKSCLLQFEIWFRELLSAKLPQKITRTQLMKLLAHRARLIRDEARTLMTSSFRPGSEEERVSNKLKGIFKLFKTQLDETLNEDSFASAVAQILIFALVVARNSLISDHKKTSLSPQRLITHLIKTGVTTDFRPFRVLASIVALSKSSLGHIAVGWSEAALLLAYLHSDIDGMEDYHKIYEEFHAEFNPAEKMDFGVYATPKELASFIIKVTELLLQKDELGKQLLYSSKVKVIDPGCGTGTFLEQLVLDYIQLSKNKKSGKTAIINGIEILPVPYALAQMRLEALENKFNALVKPLVLMGNSLSDPVVQGSAQGSTRGLTRHESFLKKEFIDVIKAARTPITVVLGNPPVSDKGFNMGKHFQLIEDALEDFRPPVSKRRARMNILKSLQNDCIKFLRWACLKIEQSRGGVIAFVIPSSLLNDVSYRHLRTYLTQKYDEIYILNIDKDIRQKGESGESLFATQQGRAAIFIVKYLKKKEDSSKSAKLFYFGLSEAEKTKDGKLKWLAHQRKETDLLSKFTNFESIGDSMVFMPLGDVGLLEGFLMEYNKFWSLDQIFKNHVSGVKTGCTGILIHSDKERLEGLLKDYANESISDDELMRKYFQGQVKKGAYQYGSQRVRISSHLKKGRIKTQNIREYQFRPFVKNYIYYDPEMMTETKGGRPRPELDLAFSSRSQENVGVAVAQNPSQLSESIHPFISPIICLPDNDLARRGNAYIFAAYFPSHGNSSEGNIANVVMDYLKSVSDETDYQRLTGKLVYYIYAILCSNTYLKQYEKVIYHNLSAGFVRIPLTLDKMIFMKLSNIGETLFKAASDINQSVVASKIEGSIPVDITKFIIRESKIIGLKGDDEVLKVNGIRADILSYMTNGYSVIEEWLKRRSVYYLHRSFNNDDLQALLRVAKGIQQHIDEQPKLSALIKELLNKPCLENKVKVSP